MPKAPERLNTFESLLQIISDLRGPEGCPWDKKQTHQSLSPYAIEETAEMVEAIEKQDDQHLCEELGDVLFQVALHAAMAQERKAFDIYHVIEGINEKIVRRHPHVFSNLKVESEDEILKNWDEIKKQEKLLKPEKISKAIDVPESLPALQRAHKIGEKTQKVNFDWSEISEVLQNLKNEIIELEEAMTIKDPSERQTHLDHEMGDVLFSAAQVARHLNIEPESSLRTANRRFIGRFEKMLSLGKHDLESFRNTSSDEKEKLWQTAKKHL